MSTLYAYIGHSVSWGAAGLALGYLIRVALSAFDRRGDPS